MEVNYNKSYSSNSSGSSSENEDVHISYIAVDTTNSSEESNGSYTRRQKYILVCCLLGQFLSNVVQSLPAPFLPSLNESHNIQSDMTGWIIGLMPLTQLFIGPVYGKMIGYIAAKTLLVMGLFVCGGFTILFGMLEYIPLPDAADTSIDVVYLIPEIAIRILQAFGAAAILISAMTLLTTTFPRNTNTILGYSSTAMGLGYMCGPAIGSGLYVAGGFIMVFGTMGAAMLVISLIVWYLVPLDERTGEEEDNRVSLCYVLANKDTILALLLTAFIGSLWSSIEPVIEPELRTKFGLTEEISALTFLLASFTYTITSPIVGKALDTLNWLTTKHLMIVGFSINSFNFLLMGPSPILGGFYRPLWLLLFCLAVLGFAVAIVLVPSLDLISFGSSDSETEINVALDKSTKAVMSGLWSSAYAFGDFLGPTFSGIMTEHVSFEWTMTSYSIACLVTALLIASKQIYVFIADRCHCNRTRNEETLPLLGER